jgi:DNA-binding response OmpR family regulator
MDTMVRQQSGVLGGFFMQQIRKVLLIDDDVDNQSLLTDVLSGHFTMKIAKDGEEGYRMARSESPDLILLDLLMPRLDGLEACALLRSHEATKHIPIIVLTGSNDFEMQLKAFDLGADDLLIKPFRPRELLARIASKLKRFDEIRRPTGLLTCGDMEMDVDRFECRVAGNPVLLSVLEFNLLRFFVENFNRVLSRETILQAVWKDAVVTDRTVDTHMTSLRKKIQKSTLNFVTLYGAGYVLRDRTAAVGASAEDTKQQ